MIDRLQDEREAEKEEEIRTQLGSLVSSLDQYIYIRQMSSDNIPFIAPSGLQIASKDPFCSLVKVDSGKRLTLEDIKPFEPQLLAMLASWREDTDRYLVSLVPHLSSIKGKEKSPTHILELATTFFTCYKCSEPISYPRVLKHECLMRADERDVGESSADAEDNASEEAAEDSTVGQGNMSCKAPREPRPPREITPQTVMRSLSASFPVGMHAGKRGVAFDEEAHNAAHRIVEACGEDADRISYIKMQEKDARLECLRCSRARQGKSRSRLVMSWTIAVSSTSIFQFWFVSDFIPFLRSSMIWKCIVTKLRQGNFLLGGRSIVSKTLREFERWSRR